MAAASLNVLNTTSQTKSRKKHLKGDSCSESAGTCRTFAARKAPQGEKMILPEWSRDITAEILRCRLKAAGKGGKRGRYPCGKNGGLMRKNESDCAGLIVLIGFAEGGIDFLKLEAYPIQTAN